MRTRPFPNLNRRQLLRGLGAAAALPFLARLPLAHAALPPKRLVIFFSPNEPIDRAHWEPGANLALHPVMSALEPHKQKLVLIGGLRMGPGDKDPYSGHNCIGQLLTGRANTYYGTKSQFWGSDVSVDQYLARALGTPALTLGAHCGRATGTARMSYAGPSQPVHPIEDPAKAFSTVFGNTTLAPDALAARQAQRKSVLDVVARDLAQLQAGLPSADRPKLERHLDALRELELKLTAPAPTQSCSPTPLPGGIDPTADVDFPHTARRQADLLTQALACDLTRVASLQLGGSASTGTPNWPSEGVQYSASEHDIAHAYYATGSASAVAERRAVEAVHYKLFAYLLAKLDSVQEGNGTLLDNTLVLWTKPMAQKHGHTNMLFMLAGSAQGQLRTGRFLQFPGVSHNNLLLSVCHLMGQTQLQSFGDPTLCSGPLTL